MKAKIKAIELFAGAGGMALGLQQAGLDVVAAVENDKSCVETLKANKAKAFPNMNIIQADITTLTGEFILNKVGLAKGQLDVLSGGPPCQGFSYSSSRRSVNDPRSKMMWQYIRMVKEIQPRYFVIENVRGLMNFKDFFRTLLKTLEKCGYVVRFNLLDAASYGVPQRRLRVFIDGARSDMNIIPKFPAPTHFDLDKKAEKSFPPASLVAVKCFATNGFTRDEVDDVWFNTRLGILMNKKKAAVQIEQAVNTIVIETVFEHIEKNSGEKLMAKKKAKSKDCIHKSREPHILPCKLSEKDRAEAADKLATAIQRVESLELEKRSKVAEFKGLIDVQKERIHKLTIEVKDGVAERPVDCELALNYSKLSATLTRFDIDEIVEERPMSEEEKQMELDFEEKK